jgi:hypothetical protein
MALLRHTPTGDLYPYNADLARRDDMVAYTPPPEGSIESAAVVELEEEIVVAPVKVKAKAAKSRKKAPVPEDEDLNSMFGDLADELDEMQ